MSAAPQYRITPSRRLDAPELGWLLNRRRWLVVLMPGLLTFGGLYGLGVFLEGRFINPLEQYAGVFPGDLFLWLGMGSLLFLAVTYFEWPIERPWYAHLAWPALCAALALSFGVSFTYM